MLKMNMKKLRFGFLSLMFVHSASADAPFRWATYYQQGYVLADIRLKGGDILEISCNQGGTNHDAAQDLFISYSVNPENGSDPAAKIK